MGWELVQLEPRPRGEAATPPAPLQFGMPVYLTHSSKEYLTLIPTIDENPVEALARIEVGHWGVKLTALSHDVRVKPKFPKFLTAHDPTSEEYHLSVASDGRSESIFLREGDSVFLSKATTCVKLAWNPSQVQVDSSLPVPEIPESDQANLCEEETEDDDDGDLDRTPLAPKRSGSTPANSVPHSVVQETPTADRLSSTLGYRKVSAQNTSPSDEKPLQLPILSCPTDVAQNDTATGAFSTASSKPVKEDTGPEGIQETPPAAKETPLEPSADMVIDDVQDDDNEDSTPDSTAARELKSILQSTAVSASRRSTKQPQRSTKSPKVQIPAKSSAKKRKSEADDESDGSRKRKKRATLDIQGTPKGTRSSQGSVQADGDESGSYEGPKPRVAFSNSGITPTSAVMKFLKKQGGIPVESVKGESCNILCVRDGALRKSMKLLLCVAHGIPIVTDAWLVKSAQQSRLLPLDSFKPSVPDQEKEWNFLLDAIWGKPQNIFTNYSIYFTPSLKAIYKPFSDIEEVCKEAGARRVLSKAAKDVKDKETKEMIILSLGEDSVDEDSTALMQKGLVCYSKDFLTLSILRGQLDLNSEEFRIKAPVVEPPKKRGRPRKS
ncbi:hypothetical protein K504DRAFT_533022 [Pleomassaria siparia CBS 279.74]|uniref:BRCT domain-containing protein n=1 Tax=Pleomassaria siparia CBS 279.74 TaxID=1314801 RepID=A0A6G1KB27_9PLEO|nr:hypothetical protein K504DRAFT_533022 [Pleomassaria siparia CBS 279.74]